MGANAYTEIEFFSADKSTVLVKLGLPDSIGFDSSYGWSGVDGGFLMDVAKATKTNSTLEGTMSGLYNAADAVGNGLGTGWAEKMSAIKRNVVSGLPGVSALYGATQRKAVNPKQEILFQGVSQREFSLSWTIASTSEVEMRKYLLYINQMYYACAPDVEDDAFFFMFPDTAKIRLVDNERDIVKKREVAVRSINTDITPDGVLATYAGGTPVKIRLSMSFVELAIGTRKTDFQILGY